MNSIFKIGRPLIAQIIISNNMHAMVCKTHISFLLLFLSLSHKNAVGYYLLVAKLLYNYKCPSVCIILLICYMKLLFIGLSVRLQKA